MMRRGYVIFAINDDMHACIHQSIRFKYLHLSEHQEVALKAKEAVR